MAAEAQIRLATVQDADAIARVLVDAWRESYASLMPPEALERLNVEEQASRWRETIQACSEDSAGTVIVAGRLGEAVFGFGACGRQRSPRLQDAGFPVEFSSLYLLRRAQGRGLGRALMQLMATHLTKNGFASASAWVFRDNFDARRFYEAVGGERTGIDGEWSILGLTLADMSYGWEDLTALANSPIGRDWRAF